MEPFNLFSFLFKTNGTFTKWLIRQLELFYFVFFQCLLDLNYNSNSCNSNETYLWRVHQTFLMEACRNLKEEYDACFNVWFSQKFLKGDHNDEMCSTLLKVYKECVEKTMKENHIEVKDAEIDYLGTDKECKPPSKEKPS